MHLIMVVKNALKLVIKGREMCNYELNDRVCCMVELFLLLRGKLATIEDHEIQNLVHNDWNLLVFVKELIQAIIPSKKFGASGKCNEEVKVYTLQTFYLAYYQIHTHCML